MTYVQPLTAVLLLLLVIGLVRMRRCSGIALPAIAVLGLCILSWPPLDWLFSRPLEMWYPVRPFSSSEPVQAIVVLSAAVSPPQFQRPYPLADKDTYERCEYARQQVPVLACGGPPGPRERPLAVHMRDLLERAGVPASMIWTEERSRTTYENALYGADVLRSRGITRVALVVEAQSMLRAEACFRRQGLTVVPAPCSFREWGAAMVELVPTWEAMERNERTLHETLGLAWYKLRGRI
jgi:uncharacterized SAM-binding protein YcdF (DUF218 family)